FGATTLRLWSSPRRLALAVAVLGALLLAPKSALASCGHYVVVGQKLVESTPDKQPATPATQHPLPAAPSAPCSGPNCSSNPGPAPLAPVPLTLPSTGEEWANRVRCPNLPDATGCALNDSRAAVRGLHGATPPDPPPRSPHF